MSSERGTLATEPGRAALRLFLFARARGWRFARGEAGKAKSLRIVSSSAMAGFGGGRGGSGRDLKICVIGDEVRTCGSFCRFSFRNY